jgi:hypothetical protein
VIEFEPGRKAAAEIVALHMWTFAQVKTSPPPYMRSVSR